MGDIFSFFSYGSLFMLLRYSFETLLLLQHVFYSSQSSRWVTHWFTEWLYNPSGIILCTYASYILNTPHLFWHISKDTFTDLSIVSPEFFRDCFLTVQDIISCNTCCFACLSSARLMYSGSFFKSFEILHSVPHLKKLK